MTKKQDFYPLPGFPITEKFTTIESIREYLYGEKICCLICGRTYKGLLGHIPAHKISADEYKERFGLPYRTGLTSAGTKIKNKNNGLLNVDRLAAIRTPESIASLRAAAKVQRNSSSKILQSRKNVACTPIPESPFSIDDAVCIFRHMVDFNVSLHNAVKATGIMGTTAFWNLLSRYPDELIPEYEEARSRVSKGVTNPLMKRPDVIADVRGQRAAGVPRKVIAEKYGIHVEYVTILERGFRDTRTKALTNVG